MISDIWILSYPLILAVIYPLMKRYYGGKVHDKPFSIVYSLAIFLPIYIYLIEKIVNSYSNTHHVATLLIASVTYHVFSITKPIMKFNTTIISSEDILFVSIYVALLIIILVLT